MSLAGMLGMFVLVRFASQLGIWSLPLLVLAFIAMLYFGQEGMLYVPSIGAAPRHTSANPKTMRSPAEWGLPYEDVRIETRDGVRIAGWWIPAPPAPSRAAQRSRTRGAPRVAD